MIDRDLYDHYKLKRNFLSEYKGYKAFQEKDELYIIVPTTNITEEELQEIKQMSDYLKYQLRGQFAEFVLTTSQTLTATVDGEQVVLFKIGNELQRKIVSQPAGYMTAGEQLAIFHQRGRNLPFRPQVASAIGKWRQLWMERLDQLEAWWSKQIQETPKNNFERQFYLTFPYYLGMTENAIQYMGDCEWDDYRKEMQMGTICHQKYRHLRSNEIVKLPTELIYDHPARDIAEWLRTQSINGISAVEMEKFLHEYQRTMPLSPLSWRMVYGRLLFPLPFFELVEGYYLSETDAEREQYEKQFLFFVNKAEEYESFLRDFSINSRMKIKNLQLPKLEWLYRVKK